MDPTLIPSDGSAAERPEETGGGLALDPDAEPSAVRLDALLTADPKFRRSWGQDRKDHRRRPTTCRWPPWPCRRDGATRRW